MQLARLLSLSALAKFLTLVWAAFWLWFCLATLASESWPPDLHGVGIAAAIASLAAATWLFPRAGGIAMILAAVLSAWFFHHTAALTLLSLPAAIIGIISIFAATPAPTHATMTPA